MNPGALDTTKGLKLNVAGIGILSVLLSLAYLNTLGDDTFIYLRLIENFLQTGHMAYNPGEPCYAATSLTYFLSFAGCVKVFGITHGRWVLSILSHIFAVGCLYGLSQRLVDKKGILLFYISAVLLNPFYLRWFWSGWEMSFKIAAMALALWALIRAEEQLTGKSAFIAGLAMGFAILTRPEALFLSALGGLYLLSRNGLCPQSQTFFHLFLFILATALVIGPWMVFAYHYFGWALPHTVFAKTSQGIHPDYLLKHIPRLITILIVPDLPVYATMACVLFTGIPRLSKKKLAGLSWNADLRAFLLVAIWGATVGGYLLKGVYISSMKVGLFSPFFLLAVVMLMDHMLLTTNGWHKIRHGWGGVAAMLLVSLLIQSQLYYRFSSWTPRYAQGDDIRFIEFAQRVKEQTPKDARIGLKELGVIGYYTGRYIIDYMGLATPKIVHYLLETGNRRDAIRKYYELDGGPATHIVQEFHQNPKSIPEQIQMYGFTYRLLDSERVTRIGGRAGKGDYSIYTLYEILP